MALNMTGENKRLALQNQFGEHGYDYVGTFVDCVSGPEPVKELW